MGTGNPFCGVVGENTPLTVLLHDEKIKRKVLELIMVIREEGEITSLLGFYTKQSIRIQEICQLLTTQTGLSLGDIVGISPANTKSVCNYLNMDNTLYLLLQHKELLGWLTHKKRKSEEKTTSGDRLQVFAFSCTLQNFKIAKWALADFMNDCSLRNLTMRSCFTTLQIEMLTVFKSKPTPAFLDLLVDEVDKYFQQIEEGETTRKYVLLLVMRNSFHQCEPDELGPKSWIEYCLKKKEDNSYTACARDIYRECAAYNHSMSNIHSSIAYFYINFHNMFKRWEIEWASRFAQTESA